MKKILLTSIFGLMTLVPCFDCLADSYSSSKYDLADSSSISKYAIDKGLKSAIGSINSSKFMESWEQMGGYSLKSMAVPCLNSVITGDRYEVCKKFLEAVYDAQNDYASVMTDGVSEYVVKNAAYMEHVDEIVARDMTGEYFVSKIKYPNKLKNVPDFIKDQLAVFSEKDKKFICAMDFTFNVCKNLPTSEFVFVLPFSADGLLKQLDKQHYDGDIISWDEVPYFHTAISEVESPGFLDLSDAEDAVDNIKKLSESNKSAAQNYKDLLQVCVDNVKNTFKNYLYSEGVSGVTKDMIEAKENTKSCSLDICYINVSFAGIQKQFACEMQTGNVPDAANYIEPETDVIFF